MGDDRVAELGYSKDYGRLELLVPHGTKTADFSRILDTIFSKDIIARLPRGCDRCTSGDHFLIREKLEHVIRIDLDKQVVIGS
jgi:hypothetical protein